LYAGGNPLVYVDEEGLVVGKVLKYAKECIKNPKKCRKTVCNRSNSVMHTVCDTVRSCKGTDDYITLKLKKTQLQTCLIMRKLVSICHGKKMTLDLKDMLHNVSKFEIELINVINFWIIRVYFHGEFKLYKVN
jgi:hypothetical protein